MTTRPYSSQALSQAGFSMVEVLVAFLVAAILSLAFVAVQRQAADMSANSRTSWDLINFSQEYLLERPFAEHTSKTVSQTSWVLWPDWEDGEAHYTAQRLSEPLKPGEDMQDYERYFVDEGWTGTGLWRLQTRIKGQILTWEWIDS